MLATGEIAASKNNHERLGDKAVVPQLQYCSSNAKDYFTGYARFHETIIFWINKRPSGGDIPVPVRSPKSSTVERG